jgi:hypothetical protein
VHCNILITASNTLLVPSDTIQTGISGADNEPPLLPAPSTDGDDDVEYEVPHIVNTTEGPANGGRSGISPAYGGGRGRGRRESGTSRTLPERGRTGGIRDAAEERRGRFGKKTNFNITERDSEYYIR